MTKATISTRRVNLGQLTLNLREVGSGQLIIFLHGVTSNSAIWDPILLNLSGRARCVAIDQRGHGLSDKPDAGYAAGDFAEDIAKIIASYGGEPATVVGNSLGSRNSIAVAALYPDLVKSIVPIDFTPFIENEVFDALEKRVVAGDRRFRSREEITEYLRDRYRLMPDTAIRTRVESAYVEEDGLWRPRASPSAMVQTVIGLREELETSMLRVKCPAMIVRGAQSSFVSEEAFQKTRDLRPDLSTYVVQGVDHYVNEEAADLVTRMIEAFCLDRR
ncbi:MULTISPECIES: alpha/beta hydrolase [unclassified Beijerinckia]|uniref:alpha/beta fold hydrolase n=1 Tax=unclassified Beijerinckia TaxID=2638183 RepID=UPI000897D4DB|nr:MULTISPECIES: alpha/beta hydrolase [unclassified Beijerinckia]MDH7799272.1 2-(acetamidomethylene)succinate hydrolase [Beijerinckia sp. GAS462]SED90031.1 2-(acetamidomethylene)succinate hydrolase [Beijerinckia sp. 28-YEA-48]